MAISSPGYVAWGAGRISMAELPPQEGYQRWCTLRSHDTSAPCSLLSQEEWEQRVRAVGREDVLRFVPAFLAGATAVVDAGPAARHVSCLRNCGGLARRAVPVPDAGGMNMPEGVQQPASRVDIERLAAGRLRASERKQIVRRLLARAARSQEPGPSQPPVAEASYDRVLERAFARAWWFYQRLAGR